MDTQSTPLSQITGNQYSGGQEPMYSDILASIDNADRSAGFNQPQFQQFQQPLTRTELPPRVGPPQPPMGGYIEPNSQYGTGQPMLMYQPPVEKTSVFSRFVPDMDELYGAFIVSLLFIFANWVYITQILSRYLPHMIDGYGQSTNLSLFVRALLIGIMYFFIKKVFHIK